MEKGWKERTQTAQSMVEFALILPLLLVIIFGILSFGHFMFVYSATTSASREAARYGAAVGLSEHNLLRYKDCNAIIDAAVRVGAFAGVNASNVEIYYYDASTKEPVLSNPTADTGKTTPVARCNGGAAPTPTTFNALLGYRIQVIVRPQYTPLVPLVNIPAIPIESSSIRTILVGVTIGTVPPGGGGGPGGGGEPPPEEPPPAGGAEPVTINIVSITPSETLVAENTDLVIKYALSSSAGSPTGTVKVTFGGYTYNCDNPDPVTSISTCVIHIAFSASATHSLSLEYTSNNAAYYQNGSQAFNVIAKYKTIVALTQNHATSKANDASTQVTFTVTVSGDPIANAAAQGINPPGTVKIVDATYPNYETDPAAILQDNLTLTGLGSTGQASVSWTHVFATAGEKYLKAIYVPDPTTDFYASVMLDPALHHTVTSIYSAPLLITAPSANAQVIYGTYLQVNFNLNLSGVPSGAPDPGGNVTVSDGTSSCSAAMTRTGGNCYLPITTSPGPKTITVSYSGDANYNGQTATRNVTEIKDSTTVEITNQSPNPSSPNGQVVFTWAVHPVNAKAELRADPSGTVTISYGAKSCTASVAAGSCTLSFSGSDRGQTVTVNVVYSGDANYTSSTTTVQHNVTNCPYFDSASAQYEKYQNKNQPAFFGINFVNIDSPVVVNEVHLVWPSGGTSVSTSSVHISNMGLKDWNCSDTSTCIWEDLGVNSPLDLGCTGGSCRSFMNNTTTTRTIAANATRMFAFVFEGNISPVMPSQDNVYILSVNLNSATCPVVSITLPLP